MANIAGFNAADVEPQSFDIIPKGDYPAVMVASEIKDTKAGDSKYLNIEMVIIDGPYKGRKLWDILNLWNKNPEAVEIAKGTLSSICRAIDVLTPSDTSELHNKPLIVSVAIKPAADGYDEKNKISAYKKRPVGMEAAAIQQAQTPVDTPESGDIPF